MGIGKIPKGEASASLELKELQLLFREGSLKSAMVQAAFMTEGYMLLLESKAKVLYMFKGQRDKEFRVFSSYDAALKAAKNIGFREVKVSFD